MPAASASAPASAVTPDAVVTPVPHRHTPLEDVVGLITGSVLVSLGLYMLHAAGVVTGGTAGLALLVGYLTGLPYPVIFVLVNLPFFVVAVRRKGWSFTLRTAGTIVLVAVLSAVYGLPGVLGGLELHPLFASLVGNLVVGVGVVVIFRHRSSLGGFNIAALVLQERTGFRAGYTLMVLDGLVVLGSLFAVEPLLVLVSALGVVVLNVSLVLNHRPERYLGY
ncbi:YitT family protein [Protaetiibacter sp. SSC-01]|uniref:YitT family protein n=1 Tax=Protaetiibacter sp. SSC-01 TaxID=2759943 RepID=UPI0016570433|nr:YitT family protein [Protaetiibacter sp. SSC-01]QNO36983.1 YitT family protein [Protaetiibacter sp. SSC-01]